MVITTIEIACAAATLPCSCDYCQLHGAADCHAMRTINNPCPCSGTGRVFVLPEMVRLRCQGDTPYVTGKHLGCFALCWATDDHAEGSRGDPKYCKGGCHGRGWNPNPDFVAWWLATETAGIEIKLGTQNLGVRKAGAPKFTARIPSIKLESLWDGSNKPGLNDNPKAAFLQALHSYLGALGAEMPEVS